MLTQTSQSTGYMPDTGNVVSAGEIDGSVINGSTINGTTINGGTISTVAANTAKLYPMTIAPNGTTTSNTFSATAGSQTKISGGSVDTKFRSYTGSSAGYEAYDISLSGSGQIFKAGFTTAYDGTFSQTLGASSSTGVTDFLSIDPYTGITLWGAHQGIQFHGLSSTGTAVSFDSYGNLYGDPASTWWRINQNGGSLSVADFGTDTAGANGILLHRDLFVGNIGVNRGHTISSADGATLNIAKGDGGRANLNVGTLSYTALSNASLLSVKKDTKPADTAYWSQLINSVDLATYQYNTDDFTNQVRLSGIVDDINENKQWTLPNEFISRDDTGAFEGIDQTIMINALLGTVQEQQKQISALNMHLLQMEAKLNG